MSRIGFLPLPIPNKVTVTIGKDNVITVKGPLGELSQKVDPDIEVKIENNNMIVSRTTDQKRHKAMHGLYRRVLGNMVKGVSEGYVIEQELVGVGYRAEAKGQILEMSLGYSHDIMMRLPAEVKVETKTEKRSNPIITLRSHDKQLIGFIAAKLRALREPEPYKGKGIRFVGENVRRKAGKTASV
jgi:large subunit ribosomal protein L6